MVFGSSPGVTRLNLCVCGLSCTDVTRQAMKMTDIGSETYTMFINKNSPRLLSDCFTPSRLTEHDDITAWKRFLHYWSVVWGTQWWQIEPPHTRPVVRSFDVFFLLAINAIERTSCRWFETPCRSCDVTGCINLKITLSAESAITVSWDY